MFCPICQRSLKWTCTSRLKISWKTSYQNYLQVSGKRIAQENFHKFCLKLICWLKQRFLTFSKPEVNSVIYPKILFSLIAISVWKDLPNLNPKQKKKRYSLYLSRDMLLMRLQNLSSVDWRVDQELNTKTFKFLNEPTLPPWKNT